MVRGYNQREKIRVHHAESIKAAIDALQLFLGCDLYTKFRPKEIIDVKGKKEVWFREDVFKDEKEFTKYIDDLLEVLRKEIIRLIGKKKYSQSSQEVKK